MPAPTVALTGLGTISALGLDTDSTWNALRAGKTAVTSVTRFSTDGLRSHHAAQVNLPPAGREDRRLSRASRLLLHAAREAAAQAQLSRISEIPLCLSTTGGAMDLGEDFLRAVLDKKPRHHLNLVARYQPQQQALDLQRALGLQGEIIILGNACASGANAIGHAADLIRAGQAEIVLAGGYEALTDLIYTGFDCLQLLSPGLCRPFDQHRDGLLIGEGAGIMILENEAHARARGVAILGHILGYGHTVDTHRLTQPEPGGRALIAAMKAALADASLAPSQIAYLNAHGTGTAINDQAEAAAILSTFDTASSQLVVSSSKAQLGHTLGAAGAIEAIQTLCAARAAYAPPTANLTNPIPQLAPALARAGHLLAPNRSVMTVNLGFGGSNAALILSP